MAYRKLKEDDHVKVTRYGKEHHGQFGVVKSISYGGLVYVDLCYIGKCVYLNENELLLSTHDHTAFTVDDDDFVFDLEDPSYEIVGLSDSDREILNSLVARISALEKDFYGIKNKD